MRPLPFTKLFFSFVIFLFLGFFTHAQVGKAQLELKKKQLQKEIKLINELLFVNKRKKKTVYNDIENLNLKIERKEELVKLTNQQINQLNNEINKNINKENDLKNDLTEVKQTYKDMILKSYKIKSGKSRMMFLLASESFFQAYKRIQYIKQFSLFRKNQAVKISKLIQDISALNRNLESQRNSQKQLLKSNRLIKKSLEIEKKESNDLVYDLRSKEKKYIKQITQKEKRSQQIDKEIERLIREAIAKSNREKNKSRNFALTPEAVELSKKFDLNKGKLPWPVVRGVIIQKFGTQPHPIVKTAKIKSNGIVIVTSEKQKVRAVFDGSILSVLQFRGSNPTILIQHGKYITAYKNLSKVYVKKGDRVFSNQNIGEVFTNKSNGKSTLQFSVFQNTTPINPLLWIKKR